MMRTLLQNLFEYGKQETIGEVIFYRVFELVVVGCTLRYAWLWAGYVSGLSSVVLPLGIAEYVDVSFMLGNRYGMIVAGLLTLFVAAGFFRVSRFGYLAALFAFHLLFVARHSQGKVSHGSHFIGLAILAFAVATLAFRHRKEIHRTALGFCYFFFGLGYTSAAVCKLIGTGPFWSNGAHLQMWIMEKTVDTYSLWGVVEYNWLQLQALDHGVIGTAILTFGLLVESLAFLMWFRRFRPVIMTALAGMHIGIIVVMWVAFIANTMLLLLLAFPWARLIDGSIRRLDAGWLDSLESFSLRWA